MIKKYISLFIIFILLIILCACNISMEKPNSPSSEETNNDSSDMGDFRADESEETIKTYDNFLIKQKIYPYKMENIVLLDVQNNSDTNFFVRIKGKYFDRNGNEIASETQVFEGWYGGYQSYFLFRPKVGFWEFEYELETEPYEEECFAKYLPNSKLEKIALQISKVNNEGKYVREGVVSLKAIFPMLNSCKDKLYMTPIFIIFDNSGNIYEIGDGCKVDTLPADCSRPTAGAVFLTTETPWSQKENYVIPKELQGSVSGIFFVRKVTNQIY